MPFAPVPDRLGAGNIKLNPEPLPQIFGFFGGGPSTPSWSVLSLGRLTIIFFGEASASSLFFNGFRGPFGFGRKAEKPGFSKGEGRADGAFCASPDSDSLSE
jgi:hypothetical protein